MTQANTYGSIPGFYGQYTINTEGDIYNDNTGRKLKRWSAGNHGRGNLTIGLYKRGTRKVHTIGHLVALTFLGKRPKDHILRYKNWNRHDPRLENLHYVKIWRGSDHAHKR